MGKKPRGPKRTREALTEAELEMMTIIWRLGACTVAQILEALPPGREVAYTTVSTIVRILEHKGYVASEKAGRGHVYHALVTKEAYQAKSLDHLVTAVFDGAPTTLVRRLLDSDALSAEDLAEIRALLEKEER